MTTCSCGRKILLALFLVLVSTHTGTAQPSDPVYFEEVVQKRFSTSEAKADWSFEEFCAVSSSSVAARVLKDYGAMYVAHESIKLPRNCVHPGESDVLQYQKQLITKRLHLAGVPIILQAPAADALQAAVVEAAASGLMISPLDGPIAAARTYGDTLMLWNSRVFPAMSYWMRQGRLSAADRDELPRLDQKKKVEKILEWEGRGIWFSTDRTRSIFTSTAPPGASQHLALIALDVVEFWNPTVRSVLNRHGWFQTIIDDPGHFTYIGFRETELPGRGLHAVYTGNHLYWIPNLAPKTPAAPPTN
jgi:hypothetical protein